MIQLHAIEQNHTNHPRNDLDKSRWGFSKVNSNQSNTLWMRLAKANCFIWVKCTKAVWKVERAIQVTKDLVLHCFLPNSSDKRTSRSIMEHNSRDNTMTNSTNSRNNISRQTWVHGGKTQAESKIIKHFELGQCWILPCKIPL
jgi:hypothetical protein